VYRLPTVTLAERVPPQRLYRLDLRERRRRGEARKLRAVGSLQNKYGAGRPEDPTRDLRETNDPEAPTTAKTLSRMTPSRPGDARELQIEPVRSATRR